MLYCSGPSSAWKLFTWVYFSPFLIKAELKYRLFGSGANDHKTQFAFSEPCALCHGSDDSSRGVQQRDAATFPGPQGCCPCPCCNGCVAMWGPGDEQLPHRRSHPQIHPPFCSRGGISGSVIEAITSFGVEGTHDKTLHAEKAFSFSLWSISPNAEHIGCRYLQF